MQLQRVRTSAFLLVIRSEEYSAATSESELRHVVQRNWSAASVGFVFEERQAEGTADWERSLVAGLM